MPLSNCDTVAPLSAVAQVPGLLGLRAGSYLPNCQRAIGIVAVVDCIQQRPAGGRVIDLFFEESVAGVVAALDAFDRAIFVGRHFGNTIADEVEDVVD